MNLTAVKMKLTAVKTNLTAVKDRQCRKSTHAPHSIKVQMSYDRHVCSSIKVQMSRDGHVGSSTKVQIQPRSGSSNKKELPKARERHVTNKVRIQPREHHVTSKVQIHAPAKYIQRTLSKVQISVSS